jgi:predicted O-linked N-acetylglucosamine transferase (SPINDLY family)
VDELTDPPPSSARSSESLIRLSLPFFSVDPIQASPPVAPSPLLTNGFITNDSFNHSSEISGRSVRLWVRLLREIPESRHFLKAPGFSDEGVCARFCEQFRRCGTDTHRLSFSGLLSDPSGHLIAYGRLDIDTSPTTGRP